MTVFPRNQILKNQCPTDYVCNRMSLFRADLGSYLSGVAGDCLGRCGAEEQGNAGKMLKTTFIPDGSRSNSSKRCSVAKSYKAIRVGFSFIGPS
jgi:hypothetical protein